MANHLGKPTESLRKDTESHNGWKVAYSYREGTVEKAEENSAEGLNERPNSSTKPRYGQPRAVLVERTCQRPGCGKSFTTKAYRLKTGRGKYCSRFCHSSMNAQANHAKYPRLGERNPNFKGWRSRDKSAYKDAFRARHPEKALAHDVVEWAVRTGRLVRPELCQRCAQKPTEPLAAHHQDYTRPLIVEFLCRPCHRVADVERREARSA